jgi:hypothetical protein
MPTGRAQDDYTGDVPFTFRRTSSALRACPARTRLRFLKVVPARIGRSARGKLKGAAQHWAKGGGRRAAMKTMTTT